MPTTLVSGSRNSRGDRRRSVDQTELVSFRVGHHLEAAQLVVHHVTDPLRACRLGLAREQAVPPYVIFHDKTLLAMAARRPTTTAAMGGISGVGDVKLARYGEAFLDVIRGHVDGDGGADLPAASHVAGDDGGLLDIA